MTSPIDSVVRPVPPTSAAACADAAPLRLAHGLAFADLYNRDGLVRLDAAFVAWLAAADQALHDRLMVARATPDALALKDESELLIALAPHVEDFLADLFGIGAEVRDLQARHHALAPLYTVKRLFVQRRAAKKYGPAAAAAFDGDALAAEVEKVLGGPLDELAFARFVAPIFETEAEHAEVLDLFARYAAWATHTADGRHRHHGGVLFKAPGKIDPMRLVPVETEVVEGVTMFKLSDDHRRFREGFALTDCGTDLTGALDQANYCIWCHAQGKDSCSRGLKEKAGGFRRNEFGVPLAGCPLEEKISEMNLVKAGGHTVGALAIVTVDNPMCAATGHRICNDCMKSCIYQKQDPVDIPQVETRALKDVLALPWGFEIYSLLTRWNPLNLRRPLPKPDTGRSVLVVGLGPAGFTLAHHLMNDGHGVVAVDGLKIEPLDPAISGTEMSGARVAFRPIRDLAELEENLGTRVMAGFGGVAEYGITVRWNKNYLKLIRLLLERRAQFKMFGGIRFGGTLTIDEAFGLGFDHVALCTGAGKPTVVDMKNGLATGVRQASDFLMALQLTGAAKPDSIANLQIRLPVVVIGGGLTAIDTATEALAYYPLQVEKFLARYEALAAERSEAQVRAAWSEAETLIADEFIDHARKIRAEHEAAARENRPARLAELVKGWGGVTVAYRRRMVEAPSYTLNHEEIAKAMEEGIRFAERLSPTEVVLDDYGHARALKLARQGDVAGDPEVTLPARTIVVAAGTQPNTTLAREDAAMALDGKYFRARDEAGATVSPERIAKPSVAHVLTDIRADGRAVSFFGDLHPSFAGNVVKAMASAKQGFPVVARLLATLDTTPPDRTALYQKLDRELRATIHAVNRLTPTIVEVVVKAPAAARAFEPGQFYRLQNYETYATRVDGTALAMEGLALTGAWTDREQGLLATIVLEMGGSSDLCATLRPGEPVILMGPTGAPTEIEPGETVLLIGGGLGNAVLFSIGEAARARGGKVLYFAGYKQIRDRYKVAEIERAADAIVWCCDEAPGFAADRPQDKTFVGNMVAALEAYASGALGDQPIDLGDVDRVIAIGSDGMMAAVARARHGMLAAHLKPGHKAIGSINSPMQCMMKEICAQCLQVHKDPATGTETVVFSCANQDQELDRVDFANLRSRLSQNGTQEKLTKLWIDRALRQLDVRGHTAG
ncbi:FAD-dependent oxidoreductase [Rhodoplanes azumiensis]|uniref:FAD-dependent oxidoreductase n=1 Tax=Rhodoplanes azumiensis TaxID=1897628 RepID=A0ABW5ANJ4_9BRAD